MAFNSTAKIASGALVKVSISAVLTTIVNVFRISHGEASLNLQDVTEHGNTSGYMEHISGLQDGDEITLDIFFLPSATTHKKLLAINDVATLTAFSIVYPDTSSNTWTFNAWVMGITKKLDIGKPMEATVRLKVEGPQSQA